MLGQAIVIALCLTATVLSVPAVSASGLETWASLAASSTAFVAMSLNLFLSTRPPFVERLFGGLDRIYRLHRNIGIAVLVLILVHWLVPPNFAGLQLAEGLNRTAAFVGEIAFYALLALLAVSLVKRLPWTKWEFPYQIWRQGHRLMGVAFILVAFHQFFIKRPFSGDVMLVGYLTFFALLGIASFLYTQFAPFVRGRPFEVTGVERLPAATVIEARPLRAKLRARPGQWGFLRVNRAGLREAHPFTIAGLGPDGSIRFAIKALGDFTTRLRETLAPGDMIRVEGGYGNFVHERGGDRQLWLAGGIGITPFLAMAESLDPGQTRRIHLVHCVRDATEAVGTATLDKAAATVDGFSYRVHASSTDGRLDGERLARETPFDLAGADLWFCGPAALRQAIVGGLRKAGKALRRVEYELFEFR